MQYRPLTKSQALEVFGSVNAMADAIGVTPGAISQWPDDLSIRQQNEVVGAIFRHNLRRRYNAVVINDEQ